MVRRNMLGMVAGSLAAACAHAQPTLDLQPSPQPESKRDAESVEWGEARRPLASQRVVREFGFEEKLTADRPIPAGWFRAQHTEERSRPGYPIWNRATLDFKVARTGEGSVRLPLEGGSVSLRLSPGMIPVLPDGVYRIRAHASARDLEHARPGLSAVLLDDQGESIVGTRTDVAGTIPEPGEWIELELQLEATHPEAAYLQVELAGWQPPEYQGFAPLRRPVWNEDHAAAIWFDDVQISQVARLELNTTSVASIVLAPDRPTVVIGVRDLTGERLAATAIVRDIDGFEVDRLDLSITPGGLQHEWQPVIDRFGWYSVDVAVRSGDFPLGEASAGLCWVPPVIERGDRTRRLAMRARSLAGPRPSPFSVSFGELADPTWAMVPHIARSLGVGEVTLPAIAANLTRTNALGRDGAQSDQIQRILGVLQALHEDWRGMNLSIDRLPESLAISAGLDRDEVVRGLLQFEPDLGAAPSTNEPERDPNPQPMTAWSWIVEPLLEALGQRVSRWQIGSAGDTMIATAADTPSMADATVNRLSTLVPGPSVALGWPSEHDVDGAVLGSIERIVARVPADLGLQGPADFINRHAALFAERDRSMTIVVDPLDPALFGPRAVIDDLARRVGLGWEAASKLPYGSVSMQLEDPLEATRSSGRFVSPDPAVPAWRTLSDQLGSRRVVARFPAAEGITALLLAPAYEGDTGSAIMAWSDRERGDQQLTGLLAQTPVRLTDLFGNSRIIEASASTDGVLAHEVPIGTTPVFIEGVDLPLALFQASLRLEPSMLATSSRAIDRELIITNPWPTPISGSWYLVRPGDDRGVGGSAGLGSRGWDITPRSGPLDLAAGAELRVPLEIVMSPLQESGPIDFVVDAFVRADVDYGRVQARATVDVGLDDLDLRLVAKPSPTPDGKDLLLEAAITNRADETRELEIIVFASPEDERYRSTISGLQSGMVALRRFGYANARKRLSGTRVFVSVLDLESGARLNKSLRID